MIRFCFGWLRFAALAAMFPMLAFVAGCGSGAVSSPPTPVTPEPISITPSTATLYSELPSTFILSGGNGTYVITSSDQAAIPLSGTFTGTQLTIVPNPVGVDTPVILTIRDTGSSDPVTATLTVKPRTISNVLTITPTSSQSSSCGTALCAGGDAQVKTVLSLNGLPLANRFVKFDVLSGDVRFISSDSAGNETLVTSLITTTDNTGTAIVRIRAPSTASAQTALIQVTDQSSGFTQRASVTLSPTAAAPLRATPTTIVFQGNVAGKCASSGNADVIVTGGRPPYQVSSTSTFVVTPLRVDSSGGRFTISPNGQCASATDIAIVDAAGASATVSVENRLSTATATPFGVAPTSVSLNTCSDVANVSLFGGTGNYFASSGNGAVRATDSGSIQRMPGSAAPGTSSVIVSFSDGQTSRDVTVTLTGAALGSCGSTTSPTQITTSPTSVTLTDCTSAPTVQISGGSGVYSAVSSNIGIETVLNSNNLLTIRRKRPSDAITSRGSSCPGATGLDQCVAISDGVTSPAFVPVAITAPGAVACPPPPT